MYVIITMCYCQPHLEGPIQSNLDKKVSPSRSALKRRASGNMKSLLSPQKAAVGIRKGSISPSEDVSMVILIRVFRTGFLV